MKILVTGAGGFVGAAVVRQAVDAGHEVIGTIRSNGNRVRMERFGGRMVVVQADLRDTQQIAAMMRDHRPDAVIHVAWSGVDNRSRSERLQINDNVEASCRLLEAATDAGVAKFVGIGSQGEYGPFERKISEADLPLPTSLYGASKLAVYHLTRQLAAQAGLSYAWIRIFATYGPEDNPHWLIPSLIEQMLDGVRPRTSLGLQQWDYLFIDDLADAILTVAISPMAEGLFNLGSGRPVQVKSIVEKLRDLIVPEMDLLFGEIPYRPDQIMLMQADIRRLTEATGWSPRTTLEQGLETTVQWHRGRRDITAMSRDHTAGHEGHV